jgi:hypothetical protein
MSQDIPLTGEQVDSLRRTLEIEGPLTAETLLRGMARQDRALAAVRQTKHLSRELEGLRSDLRSRERVARRELALDARDEAEETAERARIAEFLKIRPDQVL